MSDSTQTTTTDTTTTTPAGGDTTPPAAPATKTYDEAFVSKLQAEAAEAKTKAAELEARVRADEEKKLRDNNNWEEYAKRKETEAEEARKETAKLKTSIIEREKTAAIREEALKQGLRKEAIADLSLIDFSELKIETGSDGKVNIANADKAITRLKALRPYWFGSGTPNVNHNTPGATSGSTGEVTWKELQEAEAKAKKSGSAADQQEYRDTLLKYGQQSKRS